MSRQSLVTMELEITDQLQRLAIDIAGDVDKGRVLWQAAEWGSSHPLMPLYGPIATPLLMARDALMSEWLARSGEDIGMGGKSCSEGPIGAIARVAFASG